MKRNCRLVLPGEYVLTAQGQPMKVHHVEVLPAGGGRHEVALCLATKPHPTATVGDAMAGGNREPWPIMWRGIDDEVDVVPAPPRLRHEWDARRQEWVTMEAR